LGLCPYSDFDVLYYPFFISNQFKRAFTSLSADLQKLRAHFLRNPPLDDKSPLGLIESLNSLFHRANLGVYPLILREDKFQTFPDYPSIFITLWPVFKWNFLLIS